MKLTQFTTFTLRILMYVAVNNDRPASIQQIANVYGISANHLKKAAQQLVQHGYLKTEQGRYGGILLAKTPLDINIGTIVRLTEGEDGLVDCKNPQTKKCPLIGVCRINGLFSKALNAFWDTLDQVTLYDLVHDQTQSMQKLLDIND